MKEFFKQVGATVVGIMIFCLVVGVMSVMSIVGMIAGATTDPPTLAYASTLTEKNVSAVAYSTVYPLAMFLRILSGQFVLLILWQYVS